VLEGGQEEGPVDDEEDSLKPGFGRGRLEGEDQVGRGLLGIWIVRIRLIQTEGTRKPRRLDRTTR
jgi:hypothetical protein